MISLDTVIDLELFYILSFSHALCLSLSLSAAGTSREQPDKEDVMMNPRMPEEPVSSSMEKLCLESREVL